MKATFSRSLPIWIGLLGAVVSLAAPLPARAQSTAVIGSPIPSPIPLNRNGQSTRYSQPVRGQQYGDPYYRHHGGYDNYNRYPRRGYSGYRHGYRDGYREGYHDRSTPYSRTVRVRPSSPVDGRYRIDRSGRVYVD